MATDCVNCGESKHGGYHYGEYLFCIDCWPGYDLCKKCDDYRCEHEFHPDGECHCGCKKFIEGSTNRIVTVAEFEEIKKSWAKN